jgi:hypothetical protein
MSLLRLLPSINQTLTPSAFNASDRSFELGSK